MYVSHDHRCVFVRNPKAASRSISYWLMKEHGFEVFEDSSCYWDKRHSNRIPIAWRGYDVIASVRNPYDRLVSAWSHASKQPWCHWWDHMLSRNEWEFSKFARWNADPCAHPSELPRFPTQVGFLCQLDVRYLIRFENLEEDLQKLPFVSDLQNLGHGYKGDHEHWLSYYYDEHLCNMVRHYMLADCAEYGYELL